MAAIEVGKRRPPNQDASHQQLWAAFMLAIEKPLLEET
jgi:hypothetical protein